MCGHDVTWLATHAEDRYILRPETLHAALRCSDSKQYGVNMLLLNSPSNPTGCSASKHELEALADVARQFNVVVISDEIYANTSHCHETDHVSISSYYPEGTVVTSGLSKAFGAGGWRLGFGKYPEQLTDLRKAVITAASETFSSVSTPVQCAAMAAFEPNDELAMYAQNMKLSLRLVSRLFHQTLMNQCIGVSMPLPGGGFYAFPDFSNTALATARKGVSSEQIFSELKQSTGVSVLHGTAFGRGANEWSCRVAFVDFDGAESMRFMTENNATMSAIDNGVFDRAAENGFAQNIVEGARRLAAFMDNRQF